MLAAPDAVVWQPRFALIVGATALIAFSPVPFFVVDRWLGGMPLGGASAGLLTLPLCGVLGWLATKRPEWRRLRAQTRGATWVLFGLAFLHCLALVWARSEPDALLVSAALLPPAAAAWAWGSFGAGRALALSFPILFAWFSLPWEAYLPGLDGPLCALSANVAHALLNVAGYPVRFFTEVIIYDQSFYVIVNEECSGMNMLVTLTMYTLVFGWLTQPRIRDRILLCLLVVPLAMLANGARVAVIWLLGHYGGLALAMGPWHTGSAYIIFLPVFGFLYLVGRALLNHASRTSTTS